jgi:hypothetical protein
MMALSSKTVNEKKITVLRRTVTECIFGWCCQLDVRTSIFDLFFYLSGAFQALFTFNQDLPRFISFSTS